MTRSRSHRPRPLWLRGPGLSLFVLALLAALTTCGRQDELVTPLPTSERSDFPLRPAGVPPRGSFCGASETVSLLAGKAREVGSVTVWNNRDQIVVTYRTSADAPIRATALFVGSSVEDIPRTRSGNPKVGHFPHRGSYESGTTEVVWTLSRSAAAGEKLVVAAYAELEDGEGAWADGMPIGSGGSWATRFTYVVQSCSADGLTTISCPALSPEASSALPMDHLALGGLPASLELPLAGRVTWSGGDEETVAFVSRAADGTATLLVPLHPTGTADGGDVSIRVTDGTRACPAFDLRVDPLPPAPGEFSGIVDVFQRIIGLQARFAGTTVDELKQADASGIPQTLLPLAIAQSVVDRSDNPNSMRAIAEGTSEVPVDVDMLDRLMAKTGLRDALTTVLANANAAVGSVPSSSPGASAPAKAPADVVDCLSSPIETAQVLSDCMNLASSAAFQLQGASGKVLNDVSSALGVAGLVPAPPVEAAAASGGLAIWVFQKVMEGTASLLPSDFSGISLTANPKTFLQDEEATGSWDAVVGATSNGWKLDQVALEALLQIAGVGEEEDAWFKQYLPNDLVRNVSAFFRTKLVEAAIGTTAGSDFIEIDPGIFGPVSIQAEQWSQRSLFSDAFELTSHSTYAPRKVGTGKLHVKTRRAWQGETQFGGKQIETKRDASLEVQRITMAFLRDGAPVSEITVKNKDMVNLQVKVHDAEHPERVILDPTRKLAGTAVMSYSGAGTYSLVYKAPDKVVAENLVVEDTVHTGSLATSGETPIAILAIVPGGVTIGPRTACVEPGDTATFRASVVGVTDTRVTWDASQGTITGEGLYTASGVPSGTDVTITATSVENPDLADSVIVHVGNCTCRFDMTLGGAITSVTEGPAGFFDATGVLQLQVMGHQDPSTGAWVATGNVSTTESFTGAGTYTVAQATFTDFASGLSAIYNPDTGFSGGGTVMVDSVSADRIWGSFSITGGTLVSGSDQPQPTTATATFAAARGSPPYTGLFSPFLECQARWTP